MEIRQLLDAPLKVHAQPQCHSFPNTVRLSVCLELWRIVLTHAHFYIARALTWECICHTARVREGHIQQNGGTWDVTGMNHLPRYDIIHY